MEPPETRYAKTPEGKHVAYKTLGEGPRDIIFKAGQVGIEVIWDEPRLAHCLQRFAEMGRLICLEPLGTGSSDALPDGPLPSPESWIDADRVVLDHLGSTKATFVNQGGGGCVGMLYAATYPERTESLVLVNAFARLAWADDYPIGVPGQLLDDFMALYEKEFGTGSQAVAWAPSRAGDDAFRRWFARWQRTAFSRDLAISLMRWVLNLDVRSVLPAIDVPTLVMHNERSRQFPIVLAEYLVENIAGAQFKLVPGADVFYFSDDADDVLDDIEEFITGAPKIREPDRALATVLFTDIVASTEHATRLGDRKWTKLLDQHDAIISRELDRHRGRRVNPTGDGILATFDGPARACRCAQTIVEAVKSLGIDVRSGLHCGEVELRGEDIAGIAVHIGQRVSALAGPGEVLVSRTVTDLVAGSGLEFEERGEHELKGVPGKWAIYAVMS